MVPSEWRKYADFSFEESFPDIGGLPFHLVYERRPNFVKFALLWTSCTGVYEKFRTYCKGRSDHEQKNKSAA